MTEPEDDSVVIPKVIQEVTPDQAKDHPELVVVTPDASQDCSEFGNFGGAFAMCGNHVAAQFFQERECLFVVAGAG